MTCKLIALALLAGLAAKSLCAQAGDDYLSYSIPKDAVKSAPSNTRTPGEQSFDYFLAGAEPSEKSLIGRERYNSSVLIKQELFKEGKKHGVQREWHPNGTLASESPFRDGVMHGTFRHWNAQGQLIASYSMLDGHGRKKVYDAKGTLVVDEEFDQSQRNGRCMHLSETARTRVIVWRKNDAIEGNGFSFFLDGSVSRIYCNAAGGRTQGPHIEFAANGTVLKKQWYVSNTEVSEEQYESMARNDSRLPYYARDATMYKEFADEAKAIDEEYRKMPLIKIPLEFDKGGNPVLKDPQ